MKNKKATNNMAILFAIICGISAFRQFDFNTLTFEKPAIAIVYIIGFVISIYLLVVKDKNQSKE